MSENARSTPRPSISVRGVDIWTAFLSPDQQRVLLQDVAAIESAAPPVRPMTPWGKPMSVAMTSAGRCGWVTDRRGYRYEARQQDGRPWPPIPEGVLAVWRAVSGDDRPPDCCLVNFYGPNARMGRHQDRDEGDFSAPVVSISLGDDALFRIGGAERTGPTESVWLASGDVLRLAGPSRLLYHGVDRIRAGSSRLIDGGGRINLTLRVVDDAVIRRN